jgi:hypothetical protein
MANHKGEPECITCRFHDVRENRIFCTKYSQNIPTELGPYLICRLWQGHDGKTVDQKWKDKYLPLEDVLYKHDIYMASPPQVVRRLR